MKDSVKNLCDSFVADVSTLKKECGFIMSGHNFIQLCAFLFAANEKHPEPQQIKNCSKILKEAIGNSLCFSDVMRPPTACCLSMSADAEKLIADSIANYKLIKKNYGIVNTKYISLSGFIMELMNQPGVQEEKAAQSRELFESLKKRYPSVWGNAYSVLSMLLTYSGKNNEEILAEAESISEELKSVSNDEARLLTSLMLAYSNKPAAEKTEKFRKLYEILADHKPKYPHKTELLYLAAVSMFDDEPSTAAANILEVFDELGEKSGYKGFLATIDARTRLLHASLIVMADYLAEGGRENDMYVPTITAAFLPIMHSYDITTAAIMAGNAAT